MHGFPPFRLAGYPHLLSPYGPAFWIAARGLGALPWREAVWAWRVLCAGLYVFGAWILLRLFGRRRARLVALGWGSPLAALLLVGAAHNATLVFALLAAGAYLAVLSRRPWAPTAAALLGALAASVSPLGLAPAAGLAAMAFRRGRRAGMLAAACGLAFYLASYLPYGPVWAYAAGWLGPSGQAGQVYVSAGEALRLFLPAGQARLGSHLVAASCAAIGLWALWSLSRKRGRGALLLLALCSVLPLGAVGDVNG